MSNELAAPPAVVGNAQAVPPATLGPVAGSGMSGPVASLLPSGSVSAGNSLFIPPGSVAGNGVSVPPGSVAAGNDLSIPPVSVSVLPGSVAADGDLSVPPGLGLDKGSAGSVSACGGATMRDLLDSVSTSSESDVEDTAADVEDAAGPESTPSQTLEDLYREK